MLQIVNIGGGGGCNMVFFAIGNVSLVVALVFFFNGMGGSKLFISYFKLEHNQFHPSYFMNGFFA